MYYNLKRKPMNEHEKLKKIIDTIGLKLPKKYIYTENNQYMFRYSET
jgi:hypothetical protein